MKRLDKRNNTTGIKFEPNEGERTLLSSNKGGMRSPSLDLGIATSDTREELISALAGILVEGFLIHYENSKQSSNLLPGINKGTS